MSNQEQQYVPVDNQSTFNPYRPRYVSYFTLGFALVAIVLALAAVVLIVATDILPIKTLQDTLAPYAEYTTCMFMGASVFLVLAIGAEVYSRLKTPPAAFRVKNELVRAAGQYGLIDTNNVDSWKGMFSVAPMGKMNKETKSFTLPFMLRHVNARNSFKQLEESISGFARCRSASIEEDNSRRIYNYKLTLWYSENQYGVIGADDLFGDDE